MEADMAEAVALHRWAVIAEATAERLSPAERGVVVRRIAGQAHSHPDGSGRRYSRGTIDRWIRAWRAGGLDALRPSPRSDVGTVRAHPELAGEAVALRLELPSRSARRIAVGTALAGGPPHRSQRAALPHWAPALGAGVKADWGKGVGFAGVSIEPQASHPLQVSRCGGCDAVVPYTSAGPVSRKARNARMLSGSA